MNRNQLLEDIKEQIKNLFKDPIEPEIVEEEKVEVIEEEKVEDVIEEVELAPQPMPAEEPTMEEPTMEEPTDQVDPEMVDLQNRVTELENQLTALMQTISDLTSKTQMVSQEFSEYKVKPSAEPIKAKPVIVDENPTNDRVNRLIEMSKIKK